MNYDPVLWVRAFKAAAVALASGTAALWANLELPLDTVGGYGLTAVLAAAVGRYTFHQLESYRGDLKSARARGDRLEEELEAAARRIRDLEFYAHRLRLWAVAVGAGEAELPPIPD